MVFSDVIGIIVFIGVEFAVCELLDDASIISFSKLWLNVSFDDDEIYGWYCDEIYVGDNILLLIVFGYIISLIIRLDSIQWSISEYK